ncbi:MAG: hypothetical protein ACR2P0_19860 [Acidimicrobiales bacterium]
MTPLVRVAAAMIATVFALAACSSGRSETAIPIPDSSASTDPAPTDSVSGDASGTTVIGDTFQWEIDDPDQGLVVLFGSANGDSVAATVQGDDVPGDGEYRWDVELGVPRVVAAIDSAAAQETLARCGQLDALRVSLTQQAAAALLRPAQVAAGAFAAHATSTMDSVGCAPSLVSAGTPDGLGPFSPFVDGTYTMLELGTPLSFTVEGEWQTQPVGPGYFVITTPQSVGPGDHDLVFLRPTSLLDASTGEASIAPADVQAWVASVPSTSAVSAPNLTTVSGFDALAFLVDVGEGLPFAEVGRVFSKTLDPTFLWEVRWIDHPDGPIVVVAGVPDTDPEWLLTAGVVLDSIELG